MPRKIERLTEGDWRKARWLYEQGYGMVAIAKRYHITYGGLAKGFKEGKGL